MLGFAHRTEDKEIVISEEQLKRILNIDESCLSMDGSTGRRGGRPTAVFYSPMLAQPGRPTSKSGLTTTLITGSTAAGEAIPPHFQFSTKAKQDDGKKFRTEAAAFCPKVRGTFGCNEEKEWACSIGQNTKGGMDDAKFKKYLCNSIWGILILTGVLTYKI